MRSIPIPGQLPLFPPEGKECHRCHQRKATTEFRKRSAAKDGLSVWCHACANALQTAKRHADPDKARRQCREQYQRNPERRGESSRRCEANRKALRPDDHARIQAGEREAHKQYYQEHKAHIKVRSKEWRLANKERFNANHRAFRLKRLSYYREVHRIHQARRRTRKTNAGGAYTLSEWATLCAEYAHRCLCCGAQKPLTADHVIPVSRGGTSSIGNLQPLCLSCNLRKGQKNTDYRPQE